ncbi:hypothetical protein ACIHFD_10915 [Nonomuraea sp. NPDC051941]|uniref:hypothetical protein n=1 Tax=Nonomuraea sp. NPDC051941 TaxID=3364373 RepID=UPI0037C75842
MTSRSERRGPLRRGGFVTWDAAKDELGQVRDLPALADPREPATRTQIADLIKRTLTDTDALPNAGTIRRKITQEITVEQWLAEFLNRERKI